jgi:chorismate mutase
MIELIVTAVFILLLSAWYLSFLASRLDVLHHRVETSWAHLDALLQRRAALALEIAHSKSVDAATSLVLTAAAYQAREANIVERSDAEIALSQSLRLILADEITAPSGIEMELVDSLNALSEKISVGITIHTEAVQSAQLLRSKILFKVFRLAGHAPLPMRYSFEDDIL